MVHNGVIDGFHVMRRDLMLAVAPERFDEIRGSTDSEVLFHLALTFGLEDDPLAALERAIGFVEATAAAHGIANPVQASIGVSDGESIWAVRYSSEGKSRTLFASAEADAVRRLHPDNPRLERFRDEDRVIVSEPLVGPRRRVDRDPGVERADRAARARRDAALPAADGRRAGRRRRLRLLRPRLSQRTVSQ